MLAGYGSYGTRSIESGVRLDIDSCRIVPVANENQVRSISILYLRRVA